MSDDGMKVRQYVAYRLARWKADKNDARLRGELANLRRGIGHTPGDLPELWGLLFDGFPEELMSRNGAPTKAEWAVSVALTMYALHQQGRSISEAPMNVEGATLGRSVRRLAKNDDDVERVRRRFNSFATADDMGECVHHLRGLVQLLRAEGIPLDYPELAYDLYRYQTLDGTQQVRLLWGQDFYRMVKYAEAAAETDTAPVETDTTSEEG